VDIVFIKDLRAETVIGIYDWEKEIRQTVAVDLEMGTDIRASAAADDIDQTLNYKDISKRIAGHIENSQIGLIEALAEQLATIVMEEFGVKWLRLTLHKPGAVSVAADVGVIIERGERF